MTQARDGWVASEDGPEYPPEPWYLGGDFAGSAFLVPFDRLPSGTRDAIPARHELVTVGGRALVGVTFVHYGTSGVLSYEELLVAAVVRRGARLRVSIPSIWVDSPESRAGGRALWSIPKGLGDFTRRERPNGIVSTSLSVDGSPVASLDAEPRRVGSRALNVPLTTAQRLDGRSVIATNVILGRIGGARTRWTFAPDGPLRGLAGLRPLANFSIADAAVIFGNRVRRDGAVS
ncbi:acetoacetate decarboxylase family protein [Agromyces atrinae]|uniref:acetoacetate decarboxylase family protein n=1 Tax=Agromyces atrinae TaxID=592376 RepID=UPI001F5A2C2C|nr:acetoacetate decarboxylase family protein [Agromyces atrinae]MCI2959226.1 acetoacetate decarboxylase family protein [Agromyces atrinae]